MKRIDTIYVIVTILKTKNNYRLRKFKPKDLAPNEVCYAFNITLETDDWFKRMKSFELPKITAPKAPGIGGAVQFIARDVSEQVLDRLAGREETPLIQKDITLPAPEEAKDG